MGRSSRKRILGIAIFVVVLALAATVIEFEGQGRRAGGSDFYKASANEYRDLSFINKAQISFSSDDAIKAQDGIDDIIGTHAQKRVRRQIQAGMGAYLFIIPQNDFGQVTQKLREFGSVLAQTEQIDTALVNLDFESESARLASYERELDDLDKVRLPSERQSDRKEALHGLIQASRNNLDYLRDKESVLLYLTLRPGQQGSSVVGTARGFIFGYLRWFMIFAIAVILIVLGTRVLMYFFSLFGIKTPDLTGYKYGDYGGYSNYYRSKSKKDGKRRVKRVYKDKDSSTDQGDSADK